MGSITMNLRQVITSFLYLTSNFGSIFGESYIPAYIEGTPLTGQVVGNAPADLRDKPLFRIEHKVQCNGNQKQEKEGLVHRTYNEFQTLDELIRSNFWLTNPPDDLPSETNANIETLNLYLQLLYSEDSIRNSVVFADFLSINWDGKDISFLHSLAGFLKMLMIDRVPNFMPEPPRIEKDAFVSEETPFERYLYFIAFKNSREDTPEYLKFFKSYLDTTPSWEGDEDNSDVLHPSRQVPLEYPYFYNHTYVHFLPGGYLNTRTVRISFLGNSKFTFLNETILEEWFRKLYFEQNPIKEVEHVLDVGTGTGGSAFVLGKLFPEAKVTGVDMSPGYIRFCRAHGELRNASNVEFYQANAEDLSFIESNSIDFINFAYVLHEMPAVNSKRVVEEMFRVLKPGGRINGFELPFYRNPVLRYVMIFFNSWNEDWHNENGNQGPEPYIDEYENGLKLPHYMEEIGFNQVNEISYGYFESIFTATK